MRPLVYITIPAPRLPDSRPVDLGTAGDYRLVRSVSKGTVTYLCRQVSAPKRRPGPAVVASLLAAVGSLAIGRR